MNTAKLITATPDADRIIGYCARVSNPANQDNPDVAGLLRYCAKHGHWSVFEMANAVLEIETTRDIARQILRHRSLFFQEFSQRYADVTQLGTGLTMREARLQDTKNRQNSIPASEEHTLSAWNDAQRRVYEVAMKEYHDAINYGGIAKEQARALLPEGLTPSRLYVNGTLRSWITYLQVRRDPSTQKEHRDVANSALAALRPAAPIVFDALFPL